MFPRDGDRSGRDARSSAVGLPARSRPVARSVRSDCPRPPERTLPMGDLAVLAKWQERAGCGQPTGWPMPIMLPSLSRKNAARSPVPLLG